MIGYAKVKVGDIRKALEVHGGDVTIVGKEGLVEELKRVAEKLGVTTDTLLKDVDEDINVDFSEAEMEEDISAVANHEKEEEVLMNPDHSDWSDYIMRQFRTNELDGGNPNVKGLRRLVNKELGEVVFSGPVSFDAHHPDDPHMPGRCVCHYEIHIEWKYGTPVYISVDDMVAKPRVFGSIGGAYLGSVDGEYAKYPDAMAEVRAESRCLRKALNINAVSSEELSEKSLEDLDFGSDNPNVITGNQIGVINRLSERLEINPQKFINKKYHIGESEAPAYVSIKEVDYSTAVEMVKELVKYQTDTKNIPEQIKGA